jgi:hypothetical protein
LIADLILKTQSGRHAKKWMTIFVKCRAIFVGRQNFIVKIIDIGIIKKKLCNKYGWIKFFP